MRFLWMRFLWMRFLWMRALWMLLVVLASACGEDPVTDGAACGAGECEDGEVCVHQAADLRGTCEAIPDTCTGTDACVCDDLASLCDESTTFDCEIGTGGSPDMVCQ